MTQSEIVTYDDFLKWFYWQSGGLPGLLANQNAGMGMDMGGGALVKSDDPMALGRTDYFDPAYSAKVELWGHRWTDIYKLLPKTTYLQYGDSFKFVGSDIADGMFHGYIEASDLSSEDTDVPDITDIDSVHPAIMGFHWKDTLAAALKRAWQPHPPFKNDPQWLKGYYSELFWDKMDKFLVQGVDTPNGISGTSYHIESLDRILSSKEEADGSQVSAATDPDILFGESGKTIDRSAATTYDAAVHTPGAGADTAAEVLTLDTIDDEFALAKVYSKNKNYIGLTNDGGMNALQKLVDPKHRLLDGNTEVAITMDGVDTRPGAKAAGRIQIASLATTGITIPMFTSPHITGQTTVITDGEFNIYFLDLDEIEVRVAMPVTYLSTDNNMMLPIGSLKHEHLLLQASQLVPTKFKSHCAIKYQKA